MGQLRMRPRRLEGFVVPASTIPIIPISPMRSALKGGKPFEPQEPKIPGIISRIYVP